jgi:hypothetical protein
MTVIGFGSGTALISLGTTLVYITPALARWPLRLLRRDEIDPPTDIATGPSRIRR